MTQSISMAAEVVSSGSAVLGIELGSTRIKAALIGADNAPIATGSHAWENQYEENNWTYSLEAIESGLQACYESLASDLRQRHGVALQSVAALGVSAMMHGYLPFDPDGVLLTPFRTWRNTNTGQAAALLSRAFEMNIPQRWSIAHLYQAVLDGENHISEIAQITTLAGYVHQKLTGQSVLGVGDASGVFPIDHETCDYDSEKVALFEALAAKQGANLSLAQLLPTVVTAGGAAGHLTAEGAKFLDATGQLRPGALVCPPEGDAGTGMVATNSVAPRTGNVSVGTSVFAMVVLEGSLSRVHKEIDLVTTPAGEPVAMVHCNNGASELNSWVNLFVEFATLLGPEVGPERTFAVLFNSALAASPDGGGLMAFNYLSGEPITDVEAGRPLFIRGPDSSFDLANFMRTQLFAVFATLRLGLDVLLRDEEVVLDRMFAHGGLFHTEGVAQGLLAAAIDTPISVGTSASEGGAWGMALLASYALRGGSGEPLSDYLSNRIFDGAWARSMEPRVEDVSGFQTFLNRYRSALAIERTAADHC